jgi:hypothetical protein
MADTLPEGDRPPPEPDLHTRANLNGVALAGLAQVTGAALFAMCALVLADSDWFLALLSLIGAAFAWGYFRAFGDSFRARLKNDT